MDNVSAKIYFFFPTLMIARAQKTKILLVEDSEDDAFFFDLALQKSAWPCQLVHVVDGGQAVDYLEASGKTETRPEIIFLDLKMPGLTGFDVLQWIAGQNFQPRLNVVVLSGSNQQADIVQARELGAAGYLVKPVSPDELKQRLAALTSGAELETAFAPRPMAMAQ